MLAALNCGNDATTEAIRNVLLPSIGARRSQTILTTIERLRDKGCMTTQIEDKPRPIKGGRRLRRHAVTETGRFSVSEWMGFANDLAGQAAQTDAGAAMPVQPVSDEQTQRRPDLRIVA